MNPNIVHADDYITSEKMSKSIVEASDICKKYGSKTVLSHISFSIQRNEYVCIVGKSGAGKTTLLNIIGLIEKSDSGNLLIDGRAVSPEGKSCSCGAPFLDISFRIIY